MRDRRTRTSGENGAGISPTGRIRPWKRRGTPADRPECLLAVEAPTGMRRYAHNRRNACAVAPTRTAVRAHGGCRDSTALGRGSGTADASDEVPPAVYEPPPGVVGVLLARGVTRQIT